MDAERMMESLLGDAGFDRDPEDVEVDVEPEA